MDKKNAKFYESTKYHLDECNVTYKQAVSCIHDKSLKVNNNSLSRNGRKLDGYFVDMKSNDRGIKIRKNKLGNFYLHVPKSYVNDYLGMKSLIMRALGIKWGYMNGLFIHEYKIGNKKIKSLEEHPKNIDYWLRFAKGLTKNNQKASVFVNKNGRFISMYVRNRASLDKYYPLRRK